MTLPGEEAGTGTTSASPGCRQPPVPRSWVPRRWAWGFVLAATAATTLTLVLGTAGGAPGPAAAGLPDAGALTGWGLPLVQLLRDVTTTLAVGLLLTATVLMPRGGDALRGTARSLVRWAGGGAVLTLVALAAQILWTLSDLAAVPVSEARLLPLLGSFVRDTAPGQVLVMQTMLAALGCVLALIGRTARRTGAALALFLIVAALSAADGHSAGAGHHVFAVVSLATHVVAATLWVGGLSGLVVLALQDGVALGATIRRYSPLALWCATGLAVSGLLNVAVRWADLGTVIGSLYGVVLLAKVAAFVALVGLGQWHRRRTVPQVVGPPGVLGRRRSIFVRLAVVELFVMASAFGLAVGLSRTPAPQETPAPVPGQGSGDDLLGTALSAPPSSAALFGDVHLDAFGLVFAGFAVPLYLRGVSVLRRRGDAWPARRTAVFVAGVLAVLAVTCTGVGKYALVLFSVHMAQHMVLNMVAPMLLVLGAPITLALRALPSRDRCTLLLALRSRAARTLTHPVVTTGIFAVSLFALYFTPLFEGAMRNHWGHLLMQIHFLVSGFLFFELLIGADPDPQRPPHLARVPLLLAVMLAHTVFSVVLVFGGTVIGGTYYDELLLPWAAPPLEDQVLGGVLAWVSGEMIIVGVLVALLLQWFAAVARADRAALRARNYTRHGSALTAPGSFTTLQGPSSCSVPTRSPE